MGILQMILLCTSFLVFTTTTQAMDCMRYPFTSACRGVVSLSPDLDRQVMVKRGFLKNNDDHLFLEGDVIHGFTVKRSNDHSQDEPNQSTKDLITVFSQILRKQPNMKRSSRGSRGGPTLFSNVLRRQTDDQGSKRNGRLDVAAFV